MNADLTYWEERLAQHFRELSSRRSVAGESAPVFALEHGLGATEFQAVAVAIREHISHRAPSADHALCWIVYAAEIGYGYSGDEYWQTFEEQTPGWIVRGDRYWIRRCYRGFQKNYGGAQPSGPWAEHFSIICWPITHAILPRDLQRQLARALYELRHSFSAELFESPRNLGQFIGSRSWSGTSRFQNFAQQTDLVGQVSAALLLQGRLGADGLIHPVTLERIATDLERERRAREWLRGARRCAQERATIRGQGFNRGPASTPVSRPDEARAEVAALGIEPHLVLRPRASDASCWELTLEIPDLSHLLIRFPKTRRVLTESRCVVAGASGRPLARGRCLHGAQRVTLLRWPRADEVLLQFEEKDDQLEYLLRAECLLRPGPRWLFRIASDGLAYESRGLRVRPGERYVLVTTAAPMQASDHVRPVELECEGVHGALLELPVALTPDWVDALRSLGLGPAKTVEVWPAGLGAVVWDGDVYGEWLASERPCLAIRTDHPVAALLVSIATDPGFSLELTAVTPGEPVFVQLSDMAVGLHTLRVCTRSDSSAQTGALGELNVGMRIREPQPWEVGAARSGPLVVQVDPRAPTLEQLWEGQVDIEARGPRGRNIRCVLALFEGVNAAPTLVAELPPLPLPLLPEQWRAHFERHGRGSKRAQAVYDSARRCRLEFSAEELGAFTVECEREFVPLRWALRQHGADVIARLVDDSGAPDPPAISLLTFAKPTDAISLSASTEFPVGAPGGLFIARRGEVTATLIAVPRVLRNLADLGTSPEMEASARSVEAILDVLEYARLWDSAKTSGDILSSHKRLNVLQIISRHVLSLLGGEQWARAENVVVDRFDGDLSALKVAVSSRRDQAEIAAAIALEVAALATADLNARVNRLGELARSFRVLAPGVADRECESPMWLAELSLRVASSPGRVAPWAGPHLRPGIRKLLEEVPVLARAARFMVMATDRHLQSKAAPGELYAGWAWP